MSSAISFFLATLGTGGIGKMRIHLTREMVRRGYAVDLILGSNDSPYIGEVDPAVRIIPIGSSHSLFSVPKLISYIRRCQPAVLITEKLRVNLAALRASRLSKMNPPVFTSVHGLVSHKLFAENLSPPKQRSKLKVLRKCYPRNDGFIAVSKGIAEDLIQQFDVPVEKVHVVYNPVVTDRLHELSQMPVTHPWFDSKQIPVILSAGRLVPQKDFTTLIKAFHHLRGFRNARLMILGDGEERSNLESMVRGLSIEQDVCFTGFVDNPYAYMAKADVFVLSSIWEGFGNVIVEAMAVGLPLVATDCPSGPKEILHGGELGCLVPVGDFESMSSAITQTLDQPPDPKTLRAAADKFTATASAEGYLNAFGLASGGIG